ncbi:hypothetical protein [Polyangium aurulentum]|uniref:hypothetical protein n=1 Tax=Polyangium aurulentum TaxID=2567896 RepID=UPI0010AE6DB8|nr:hypothetical protein [Polyangium aurulentum]UQA59553.1 hypothetical protein E8A73_003310 [Polyangium aurulentum]
MYSIENRVGKLVEIRIWSPVSGDEATRWGREHEAVIGSLVGNYFCFVDVFEATVLPQDVVEAYICTLKSATRMLRAAMLLGQSPTLGLQVQRMLREVNNPERKAFRDPRELEAWLGAQLAPAERTRLRELLERRMDATGPSSAPAPQSSGTPASLRSPKSVRAFPSLRPPPPPPPSNGRGNGRDE